METFEEGASLQPVNRQQKIKQMIKEFNKKKDKIIMD